MKIVVLDEIYNFLVSVFQIGDHMLQPLLSDSRSAQHQHNIGDDKP